MARKTLLQARKKSPFWSLDGPGFWGDYGRTLITGHHKRNKKGIIMLMRAGPYHPPIAPSYGALMVSDTFRRLLEASPLEGLTFHSVIKKRIVEMPWESWDREAEFPPLPDLGEPEDLILKGTHSVKARHAMGRVWEARAQPLVEWEAINKKWPWEYDIRIVTPLRLLRGLDFVADDKGQFFLVSNRAKEWLEKQTAGWVQFSTIYA